MGPLVVGGPTAPTYLRRRRAARYHVVPRTTRGNRVDGEIRKRADAAHDGPSFLVRRGEIAEAHAAGGYARVRVALEDPVAALAPGQFLMVRFSWGPALPRPLSTVAAGPYGVDLLVKVDGVLRTALGSSPRGTVVEVRGPYGVPYIARIERQRKYVLVGGGSGVAPLHHFASAYPQLVETAAFGFRSREVEQLLPGVDFASEEETGETADDRLRSRWRDGLGIIACGPEPLLASIARRYRSQPDVYVSLETRLGCGFGACLSCSIRTTAGMRRVCVDGPLFRCSELPWLG